MNENEAQAKAIAKTRKTQVFRSSGKTNERDESVSRYTLFLLAIVSLFAGGWAIICLFKAISIDGLMNTIKQLTSAVNG